MVSKIISQKENPYLERKEFLIAVDTTKAPTFDEVKKMMINDLKIKTEEELIVVKSVHGNFGMQKFNIESVAYENEKAKEKIEVIPKKVRKKLEAERKAAEEAKKAEEEARKKEEEEKKKAAEEAKKAEESAEEKIEGNKTEGQE